MNGPIALWLLFSKTSCRESSYKPFCISWQIWRHSVLPYGSRRGQLHCDLRPDSNPSPGEQATCLIHDANTQQRLSHMRCERDVCALPPAHIRNQRVTHCTFATQATRSILELHANTVAQTSYDFPAQETVHSSSVRDFEEGKQRWKHWHLCYPHTRNSQTLELDIERRVA